MITKSDDELKFRRSTRPLATVEVDIESLEEVGKVFPDTLYESLTLVAESDEECRASIYTYLIPSCSFVARKGELRYSGFIGVVGDSRVLNILYKSFSSIKGVNVKFSDHINPNKSILEYHIENGLVWRPLEACIWYADYEASEDPEFLIEGEEEEKSSNEKPFRYRSARKDATVGSIKRKIESTFGLPEGSVALLSSDDSKLKANAKIDTLRKRWDYSEEEEEKSSNEKPFRYRSARKDAAVGSIKSKIESTFGLPEGSVALLSKDGSKLKANAKIGTLRQRWDY